MPPCRWGRPVLGVMAWAARGRWALVLRGCGGAEPLTQPQWQLVTVVVLPSRAPPRSASLGARVPPQVSQGTNNWFTMLCYIQVYHKVIQLHTHTRIYIFSYSDSFHYRLWQNTECSSLGYTVDPCWFSNFYIVVCICYSQSPNFSILLLPL